MTRAREQLLRDAKNAGYQVTHMGTVTLVTRTVRVNHTATRTVGLEIFEDGTAYRVDVDLSVAAGIRSYKVMREVLGI